MNRIDRLTNQFQETKSFMNNQKPVKVLVTGGAGQIAYSIVFGIGRGKLLGSNVPIELRLLDIPMMAEKQKGVAMELTDCAFPVLSSIKTTVNIREAFEDIDIALLIGAKPRGKGELRGDLLKANAKIFKQQGKALNDFASKNVKVVVVGNPANTNALICSKYAPDIPQENFTAMTRLDQNRCVGEIVNFINSKNTKFSNSKKVKVENVQNVIVWGNHSKTMYPDIRMAYIDNYPSNNLSTSIQQAVNDNYYLDVTMVSNIQQRGAKIIKARGLSSAGSAANACLDHVRNWINGTKPGQIVSMGVISKGEYGIEKGIVYSFPCTCSNGNWNIVNGLPINSKSKAAMHATQNELVSERKIAFSL